MNWRHSSSAVEIGQILDHIGQGALLGLENGDIPLVKSDKDLWWRLQGSMECRRMQVVRIRMQANPNYIDTY